MAPSRWTAARSRFSRAALAVLGAAALLAATPALADRDDDWRGHGYGSHGHGKQRNRHWKHHDHHPPRVYRYAPPVYYAPPRVYYAPPPVYYAPPPVYYAPPAYPQPYRPRGGVSVGLDWFFPF